VTETEQAFESTAITPSGNGSAPARSESGGTGIATTGIALNGGRSASTADLVRLASEQVQLLVRDELALARLEMTTKAKRMSVGAGLFGGAGVVVVYGVGALIAGLALLLALVLPAWASALIVGGGLFLIAGLLALVGRSEVKRAGKPMPDETIDSVKTDVATMSQAVKDGRA